MFSFLAADTSPKWLLILFVCSGDPELINDPEQNINCQRIEQSTYSLKHCQNSQTFASVRITPPYFVNKSKCVEIIKKKPPNIG
tara:strand:+ start:211 stop:462 length:252 start_codon:yes stop_codon:yes gene_type:complete